MSIGALAAIVLAALFAASTIYRRHFAARADALGASIARQSSAYQSRRWYRPVLRGDAVDGNAGDAQRAALAKLEPLVPQIVAALGDWSPSGGVVEPPVAAITFARNHDPELAELRAGTQRRWAWDPRRIRAALRDRIPTDGTPLMVGRLLAARAMGSGAAECFQIAADVIRLGQDAAAGTGRDPLLAGWRSASDAEAVILHCAGRASVAELRAGARELAILARHPVSMGEALEFEALAEAASLRYAVRRAGDAPLVPQGGAVDNLMIAPAADEAARSMLAATSTVRAVRPERYPASVGGLRALRARFARSPNRFLQSSAAIYDAEVSADQGGAASLRATAVVLDALATWRATGTFPSTASARQDRALVDPFTGTALHQRASLPGGALTGTAHVSPPRGGLVVWSVGPNGRDDGATGDDISCAALLTPASSATATAPITPRGRPP